MIELLMQERRFNDRTAYIEQLVRDDWDDRVTPQMQAEMTKWQAQLSEQPSHVRSRKRKPTRNSDSKRAPEKASN